MPTYDYVCAACGHAFEHFQEMSAKKLRTCPRCKKPKLERQVGTGAGLIFKGTGFYITDYKRAGGADAAASSSDTMSGGKSGGKSDGKPDGKPDGKNDGKSDGGKGEAREPKGAGGKGETPPSGAPAAQAPPKAETPKPPSEPSKGRSGK